MSNTSRVPQDLKCPISRRIMESPVVAADTAIGKTNAVMEVKAGGSAITS